MFKFEHSLTPDEVQTALDNNDPEEFYLKEFGLAPTGFYLLWAKFKTPKPGQPGKSNKVEM